MVSRKGFYLLLATLVILPLAACAYLPQGKASPAAAQTAGTATPAATGGDKSATVYYDFDDIAVPGDFKLLNGSSFIYQSGMFRSGVLAFDGRVTAISAANWIAATMAKDNWRMKGSFKYGRTLMMFEKPGKTALVTLTEGNTYTRLEVWVLPMPEGGMPASKPAPASFPLAN